MVSPLNKGLKKPRAPQCVVLGLDGFSYELIHRLTQSGVMPQFGRIVESGVVQRMKATLPEISSVSWTSFMTGMNPGHHGIFGFVDLEPRSYGLRFPNALDRACPTLFDHLKGLGKRSLVINLPGTYPVQSFPGTLVCGFVAPDLSRAVYPASLLPRLRSMGYQIDVEAGAGRRRDEEFLSELSYAMEVKSQLFHSLWDESWDLMLLVVTETDRLHHFFYDAVLDEHHRFHEAVCDFYRQLDDLIEAVVARATERPNCTLFMLSDHGFYPLKREVNLNPLLRQSGFGGGVVDAEFRQVKVDPSAQAFALDPSRIFLHSRERFALGRLAAADIERVKAELKACLLELKVEGEAVIKAVYEAHSIYHGPLADQGADLILLPHPGNDLKGGLTRSALSEVGRFSGMHGYDNAFLFSSRSLGLDGLDGDDSLGDISIERAAEPILRRLGGAGDV